MPRAKRGFKARRRRNRVLNQTEGYFLGRKNRFRQAVEVLRHAWEYGYISRKLKKRDFRRLWIHLLAPRRRPEEGQHRDRSQDPERHGRA